MKNTEDLFHDLGPLPKGTTHRHKSTGQPLKDSPRGILRHSPLHGWIKSTTKPNELQALLA